MDNTKKFTNKVENYVKYRPSYPRGFIRYLTEELGLAAGKTAADVGAGTGILTRLLAACADTVYAVEPNAEMSRACRELCREYRNIVMIDGTAENTGLPDSSTDFVTAAQAFHWFDREKAKAEFGRILKPGGKVVLVWNSRVSENEFIKANDELCRRLCPDFNGFSGGIGWEEERYGDFFKDGLFEYRIFENDRTLTLEEYIGGSLSASYAPLERDENYSGFVEGLKDLFDRYSVGGRLLMPAVTQSYAGSL
jgi:SAM-dependent methyltransferase